MATKIRKRTSTREKVRFKHKRRTRGRTKGTAERPRLAVYRSNYHIYAQVINDESGHTLTAASTVEEDLRSKVGQTMEGAQAVGDLIGKRSLAKNISRVLFDRSGYLYHGRVKALADSAREAGLQF